jgi:hypothetical protein
MPALDVSFMTLDPMFADSFKVTRRADVVDARGRTTPTIVAVFPEEWGVITQQDPADLMRNDDGQMMPRLIFIATAFLLRAATKGFQPDIVTWDGVDYKIKHLLSYSRFGGGTIEAVAESMAATDPPTT